MNILMHLDTVILSQFNLGNVGIFDTTIISYVWEGRGELLLLRHFSLSQYPENREPSV